MEKGGRHNREEWKKVMRKAKNRRILHMPMEWMKWAYFTRAPKIMLFFSMQIKWEPEWYTQYSEQATGCTDQVQIQAGVKKFFSSH